MTCRVYSCPDVFSAYRPWQLRDGEGFERADHLGDAEQSAAHHVLLLLRRSDDVHRLQQDGDERLLMDGAKTTTEQLEAVERRLPVDGLLRLLLPHHLMVTFTHNAQQVAGQL